MTQVPDANPGNYYVSMRRNGGYRLLAGPFRNDHAGALAMVDRARVLACDLDPWSDFDAFGTVRLPDDNVPGILNDLLGLPS